LELLEEAEAQNRFNALALHLPSSCWDTFPPEEGVASMGFSWGNRILAGAATFVLAAALASAQQTVGDEGKRKIKFRTNPQFTDLARRMNLSGKVKIEVVIAPDGHVKSSRAVGGHPVLVQSCLEAVKEWKFESAPEETTQVFEFEFKQ
jgi:TonB family protein